MRDSVNQKLDNAVANLFYFMILDSEMRKISAEFLLNPISDIPQVIELTRKQGLKGEWIYKLKIDCIDFHLELDRLSEGDLIDGRVITHKLEERELKC